MKSVKKVMVAAGFAVLILGMTAQAVASNKSAEIHRHIVALEKLSKSNVEPVNNGCVISLWLSIADTGNVVVTDRTKCNGEEPPLDHIETFNMADLGSVLVVVDGNNVLLNIWCMDSAGSCVNSTKVKEPSTTTSIRLLTDRRYFKEFYHQFVALAKLFNKDINDRGVDDVTAFRPQ